MMHSTQAGFCFKKMGQKGLIKRGGMTVEKKAEKPGTVLERYATWTTSHPYDEMTLRLLDEIPK